MQQNSDISYSDCHDDTDSPAIALGTFIGGIPPPTNILQGNPSSSPSVPRSRSGSLPGDWLAAWSAWRADGWRRPMVCYFVQLGLNAAWTPVFFGAQQPGWALVVIVALWRLNAG